MGGWGIASGKGEQGARLRCTEKPVGEKQGLLICELLL